jgi:hypothetical protein
MRLLPQKSSVKSYFLGEVLASVLVEAPTPKDYACRSIDPTHLLVTTGGLDFCLVESSIEFL